MAIAFNKPLVCPVLIGRGHDLASLRLLVDRAKSGQGHVALLSGEAGIGKSRLMAEVKTEALAHNFWLLQGSCFPTDYAIPYAPLLDLLRSHIPSRELALAAWELGIGSCIASMWEPEKAKAILGVPHDQHFDVAISFGYPLPGREQSHPSKPNGRKPFGEVVFWDRWGG